MLLFSLAMGEGTIDIPGGLAGSLDSGATASAPRVYQLTPGMRFGPCITVKALGPATAQLTMLALKGTPFKIVMEEVDEGDVEWSLTEVLLDKCIITNAVPSSAAISGAPTATFSGFALGGRAKTATETASAGAPVME